MGKKWNLNLVSLTPDFNPDFLSSVRSVISQNRSELYDQSLVMKGYNTTYSLTIHAALVQPLTFCDRVVSRSMKLAPRDRWLIGACNGQASGHLFVDAK